MNDIKDIGKVSRMMIGKFHMLLSQNSIGFI